MTIYKARQRDISAYVLFAPAFIVLLLFMVYPIIWSLILSFKAPRIRELRQIGLLDFPGKFVGLANYGAAFDSPLFIKSLLNTLYFGLVYYPLTLAISLFLAVLLNGRAGRKGFFYVTFFMPYVVSIVSTGVIFLSLFRSDTGMINNLLRGLGVADPIPWLSSETWAMPVISLMSSWRKIGYFMLIFLAGLQSIPGSLYEAANIDGARPTQQFWRITLPLLSKILVVASVLLMVDILKVFQEIYVVTGGGPNNSTTTVPFLIYNEAFRYFRVGSATAMSYILLIGILFFLVLQRLVIRDKD